MNKEYYENMRMIFEHYNEFLGLNEFWDKSDFKDKLSANLEKAKEFIAATSEHALEELRVILVFPKLRVGSDSSLDLIYEEMDGKRFFSLNIGETNDVPYFGHDEHMNIIQGKMKYSDARIAPLLFWKI